MIDSEADDDENELDERESVPKKGRKQTSSLGSRQPTNSEAAINRA